MKRANDSACDAARERMHRLLDGGPVDAAVRAELDRHVQACAACAESWDGLRSVQSALRALPLPPMPDADLDRVLARTRFMRPEPATRRSVFDWRVAAASVLLALGLWALSGVEDSGSRSYTLAQQQEAAAEARLALKIVADALGRARQVGMGVLSEEVAPALERIPIKLPAAPPAAPSKDSRT